MGFYETPNLCWFFFFIQICFKASIHWLGKTLQLVNMFLTLSWTLGVFWVYTIVVWVAPVGRQPLTIALLLLQDASMFLFYYSLLFDDSYSGVSVRWWGNRFRSWDDLLSWCRGQVAWICSLKCLFTTAASLHPGVIQVLWWTESQNIYEQRFECMCQSMNRSFLLPFLVFHRVTV